MQDKFSSDISCLSQPRRLLRVNQNSNVASGAKSPSLCFKLSLLTEGFHSFLSNQSDPAKVSLNQPSVNRGRFPVFLFTSCTLIITAFNCQRLPSYVYCTASQKYFLVYSGQAQMITYTVVPSMFLYKQIFRSLASRASLSLQSMTLLDNCNSFVHLLQISTGCQVLGTKTDLKWCS